MKILNRVFLGVTVIILSACSVEKRIPAINFVNYSNDPIFNIRGDWNGYYFKEDKELSSAGDHGYGYFTTKSFTPFSVINLSWKNAKNQFFEKSFVLQKSRFENPRKFGKSGFIYFYFYQDHVEIYPFEGDINEFWKFRDEKSVEFLKERYESLTLLQKNQIDKIVGEKYRYSYRIETLETVKAKSLMAKFIEENKKNKKEVR